MNSVEETKIKIFVLLSPSQATSGCVWLTLDWGLCSNQSKPKVLWKVIKCFKCQPSFSASFCIILHHFGLCSFRCGYGTRERNVPEPQGAASKGVNKLYTKETINEIWNGSNCTFMRTCSGPSQAADSTLQSFNRESSMQLQKPCKLGVIGRLRSSTTRFRWNLSRNEWLQLGGWWVRASEGLMACVTGWDWITQCPTVDALLQEFGSQMLLLRFATYYLTRLPLDLEVGILQCKLWEWLPDAWDLMFFRQACLHYSLLFAEEVDVGSFVTVQFPRIQVSVKNE